MPNRLIKESITTSEDIDRLSLGAEILFYRLMVKADDFGIYYGNAKLIRSECFPLRADTLKASQVEKWLEELDAAGLIIRYIAEDGRAYLKFSKWERHQQIRATKSKFPQFDGDCCQLISNDINGNQMKSNVLVIQSNPIQSESNPIHTRNTSAVKSQRPTLEDVKAYVIERGSNVDPVKFFEYYEAGDWKDSKGSPVKNWKQKLISWEKHDPKGGAKKTNNQFLQMLEEEYGQTASD